MNRRDESDAHQALSAEPRHVIAGGGGAWNAAGPPAGESGLMVYLRVLRRHLGLIVVVVGVSMALGLGFALLQPRMYEGLLTLQVQANPPVYVPSLKDVESPADSDTYYTTQLGIIRSRAVAQRVARHLNLAQRRTLVEAPGTLDILLRTLTGGESGDAARQSTDGDDGQLMRAAVHTIQSNLTVFRHQDSELVEVHYAAPDADLAARVANLVGKAFRDVEDSQRVDVSQHVRNWLSQQLDKLRGNLAKSEQKLQQYKQKHGLLDTKNLKELTGKRISGMSQELLNARSKRMRAEVRYDQVKQADNLDALVAVLDNPVIQQLKMQQANLQARVKQLGTTYGHKAPKMEEAQAQLDSVTDRLHTEVNNAVASIRKQYQEAKATEQRLEQAQNKMNEGVRNSSGEELQLAKLEREVETNRQLFQAFRSRMKEISVAGTMGATGIRVVDDAVPPNAPFQPSYARILGIAGLLSLAGGVALAFLMENVRRTFHTPQDMEGQYRLRGLGVMPKVTPGRHASLNRLAVLDPDSEFTAAMGGIRTRLQGGQVSGGPQVVMVTSALQGEGKTTLSSNLASSYAQLQGTLLVDADLRRASLSSQWQGLGLTDFVMAGAELSSCVGRDNLSPGLYVMGKGQTPVNALDFFALPQFAKALAVLRQRFERIIIDTAPLLNVSDVEMMGHLTDGAIVAVRAGKTPNDAVTESLRRLHAAGIPVLGVTLTQADMKEVARYGGYAYGYRAS